MDRDSLQLPSFGSPPAIVWMILLGSIVMLIVLAKVFATVSVSVSGGVKG